MRNKFILMVVALATLTPGIAKAQNETHPLIARTGNLNPVVQVRETPVLTETVEVRQSLPSRTIDTAGGNGYILPGNNCVACVLALTGRSQNGNAGTWQATSSTPYIGAIAIFRPGQQGAGWQGHVGVVVGIRGNKIELAHCNYPGRTEFEDTGAYF